MIPDVKVLQKLSELPLVSGPRQRFDLTIPGLAQVTVDIQTLERLGGELWEVVVTPERTPVMLLTDHATGLAKRLTGLLESLSFVECDTLRGIAMLRSEQPMKHDQELSYYELLVEQNGKMNLRRYQNRIGGTRHQVPFVLTREALAKAIADLATPVI